MARFSIDRLTESLRVSESSQPCLPLSNCAIRSFNLFEILSYFVTRLFELIAALEVHPKLRRRTEVLGKTQSRIGADALQFPYNALQSRPLDLAGLRKSICSDAKRLHKLLTKNLSGMKWCKLCHGCLPFVTQFSDSPLFPRPSRHHLSKQNTRAICHLSI